MFSILTASKLTQTLSLTYLNFSTTLLLRRFLVHFKGAKLVQAINRYEHALALLWYFQPTVEDWRKKGIQDENMELIDLRTKTSDPEVTQKITIMISQILTNIAVIKLKESKFSECVKCSSVSKK